MLRIKTTIYLTGQVKNNDHPDDGTNSKQSICSFVISLFLFGIYL